MRVIDPGHLFLLESYDGGELQPLVFVKRCKPPEKYPGNASAYSGTNLQDVLRACIARVDYLQGQSIACENENVRAALVDAIYQLEVRAHRKHASVLTLTPAEVVTAPTCSQCGHVACSWCHA